MEYFLQQLANGLAAGSVYSMVAVGYSLIYGALQLINFAHGDIYMFGTFVAVMILGMIQSVWWAIPIAIITSGLIGMTVERIAYRPVRSSNRIAPMISAVGAALIIRNLAQVFWGTRTYPFPSVIPYRFFTIGGVTLSTLQITLFFLSLFCMWLLTQVLKRTKMGQAILCVAQDIQTAQLMGIPVNRIISLIYGVGAMLGAIGGILFAVYYNSVFIGMGFLGTMKAWTAAVIGGIGNMYGAFIGGIMLGVMESFASGYISSAYRDAISFGILILVLVFRPNGLLGKQVTEKV